MGLDEIQDVLSTYTRAAADVGATITSGAIAEPVSGWTALLTGDPDAVEGMKSRMTYQPKTEMGKRALHAIGNTIQLATQKLGLDHMPGYWRDRVIPSLQEEAGTVVGSALGAGSLAALVGLMEMGGGGRTRGLGRYQSGGVGSDKPAIRAFHGSHQDFDKFSSDYIGTGEGAQAYGHGHYSAQSRDLGELYRQQAVQDRTDFFDPSLKDDYEIGQTAGQMGWNLYDKESGHLDLDMPTFRTQKEAEEALESGRLTGQVGFSRIRNNLEKQLMDLGYSHYVAEEAADRVGLAMLEDGVKFDRKHSLGFYKKNRDIVSDGAVLPDEVRRATIDALELSEPIRLESAKGRLYEIDIDASPDELLDWDKPLNVQSSKVQDAVEDILKGSVSDPDGVAVRGFDGETIDHSSNWSPKEWKFAEKNYRRLGNKISTNLDLAREKIGDTGESYHQALSSRLGGQDKLAKALQERGVKGIQYKDAFSRTGEGGTSNYVVFDENLISIANKYGISIPAAAMLLSQGQENDEQI